MASMFAYCFLLPSYIRCYQYQLCKSFHLFANFYCTFKILSISSETRMVFKNIVLFIINKNLEQVVQRCSVRKALLKISQNLQGNTCHCVSFFIKLQAEAHAALLKMRLWHTSFPVNFSKYLRTPLFIKHVGDLNRCSDKSYQNL